MTVDDHVMAALRPRLTANMLATSAQLHRLPPGCSVAVAGLVIARQRPGTAGGTMFLLFEDEWGTVNLIVPRAVYERHRHLARAEPLLLAKGRLERHDVSPASPAEALTGGERARETVPPVLNVIVRELHALERFLPAGATQDGEAPDAQVHELAGRGRSPLPGAERAL